MRDADTRTLAVALPRVVAGLFGGLRLSQALDAAASEQALLERWDDRHTFVSRLAARPPAVLLVPVADAEGVPTAPLVERCAAIAPAMAIVLVTSGTRANRGLMAVMRAAPVALHIAAESELRDALAAALAGTRLDPAEEELLQAAVRRLAGPEAAQPAGQLLLAAAMYAHERPTASVLAARLHVTRRTLARWTVAAGWPPPSELIVWGRLLRGAALAPRVSDPRALASASGFASAAAQGRAQRVLLGRFAERAAPPHPSVVVDALARRGAMSAVRRGGGPRRR